MTAAKSNVHSTFPSPILRASGNGTGDQSCTVDCSSDAPSDWDDYVNAHPSASAYHLARAVAIGQTAFGLRTFYLAARGQDKRILGVLPLVEQSSWLFGRYLISVPFFTYGGLLADTATVASAIVGRATQLAADRKARHVELRHTAPLELGLPERVDKVSMVLPLPNTEEAFLKQIGSKLRSQVRRAEREQLEITWGREELIPEFYPLFAATMHELGTPVYPKHFFTTVFSSFRDLISLLVVKMKGKVHGTAILVRHRDRVEVPWAVASPEGKRVSLNMRMYWEMLRHCIAQGAPAFDFGRSSVDSGTYRFKAQWGARPAQLYWHYLLSSGKELPRLNHSNPKYALAASMWRRMPLWCANLLGPGLARNLP